MEFQGIAKGLFEVELTWEPPTPYPGLTDYIISTYMVLNWNLPENTPILINQVEVSGELLCTENALKLGFCNVTFFLLNLKSHEHKTSND